MEPANEVVYIVDDEASVGEALSTLLRANGKCVELFTSGQDFLSFLRRDSCGCLILDLKMPGLGGLEVQKLISAETAIPVIFLTGRGDIPSTVRAMKGGAVDFLTKPVDEEALLASVERALRQDRATRQEAAEHARQLFYYPGSSELPAVRSGRVYAADANSYFARPGPRVVEGTELLAHLLHPSVFEWHGPPDAFIKLEDEPDPDRRNAHSLASAVNA